ncbi:unnamed protein product [Closterium sp. NIES-65]|nr:unnamed protein product [Closterium sp. NIES-65]
MCIMYQLVEPLTGKTWSLSDFDGHPALLLWLMSTPSPLSVQFLLLVNTAPPKSSPPESMPFVVMFICNHCPFVVHIKSQLVALGNEYISKHGLAVVAISSNSVLTHPQDGPDKMAEEAKQFNFPFPYLYDETQEVAKAYHAACTPKVFLFRKDGRRPRKRWPRPTMLPARRTSFSSRRTAVLPSLLPFHQTQEVAKTYHAACTPDFFLFKKDGRRPFELAYHGQLDDSRPNNGRPVTGKDLRAALDCVLSARPVPSAQRPR